MARLTGESVETLAGHRALLRRHGLAYLTDRQLFLSNNTDGPGNPLSKVFSRRQARLLFAGFGHVETEVHFLNLRTLPLVDRLLGPATRERLARRLGWHLYVDATRRDSASATQACSSVPTSGFACGCSRGGRRPQRDTVLGELVGDDRKPEEHVLHDLVHRALVRPVVL